MRRPVRVWLVVVGVRPEGEAVLDGVPGGERAGIRPAPDPGDEDAPAGIAGEDGRKPVDELRGGVVCLRQAVRFSARIFCRRETPDSSISTPKDARNC